MIDAVVGIVRIGKLCRNYECIIMNTTKEMQLYRLIYYPGNVFVHYQEHLTVFTASDNIHQCRCRLVSWMSWNCSSKSSMTPAGSDIDEYYQML